MALPSVSSSFTWVERDFVVAEKDVEVSLASYGRPDNVVGICYVGKSLRDGNAGMPWSQGIAEELSGMRMRRYFTCDVEEMRLCFEVKAVVFRRRLGVYGTIKNLRGRGIISGVEDRTLGLVIVKIMESCLSILLRRDPDDQVEVPRGDVVSVAREEEEEDV